MSPAHETQSMREIRLLRGRLPRKGGGLTGMDKGRLELTLRVSVMVFNATFNNISVISWWSVLFVEEINVREYRRDNKKWTIQRN